MVNKKRQELLAGLIVCNVRVSLLHGDNEESCGIQNSSLYILNKIPEISSLLSVGFVIQDSLYFNKI